MFSTTVCFQLHVSFVYCLQGKRVVGNISLKVLSWKVRHEIGKNEIRVEVKISINLERINEVGKVIRN